MEPVLPNYSIFSNIIKPLFSCLKQTWLFLLESGVMVTIYANFFAKTAKILLDCPPWFTVVLYQKITIYPVLKNLRNAVFRVSLIIPGHFFFAKYMENAGIKRKFCLLGVYPEQTKAMDWLILLFLLYFILDLVNNNMKN